MENSFPLPPDPKSHLFKILVIGDYAVGKTSLVRRFTEGIFTPNYKLTLGVDFAIKELIWTDQTKITLQLWDVAGHERFGNMTRVYYKNSIAAVIVFDLSRPATFESVSKWLDDVDSKVFLANNKPIPKLLIANKSDIPGIRIDREALDNYCKNNGFIAWFETSAQNDINIDQAMTLLTEKILEVAKENAQYLNDDKINNTNITTNLNSNTNNTTCC
eukprot:TRINITY_DN7362_c0_g1_i1.p1 TRINITY_DN7362_c0_g1~~TRINITY_DN7362_c0_g1_i1.p1  ORF type:complete len:217 (-),score=96.89 TRINITY_DN7362_c0_g1_i1:117-767(-)